MLPKINRLKKEKDFKKIYRFGKKMQRDFFIIRQLENNFPYSRFGFVIPASAIKKASKRNYYRRRIIEAVRLNLKKIKKGQDIVFSVFKAPDKEEDIEKEIINLIKTANLYK